MLEIRYTSQDVLEEQYRALKTTGQYTEHDIAMHLARFAEARCLVAQRQLEQDMARFRSQLPGPEVISAIRDVIDGWEHSGLDEYHGSPRHAYDSESVVKVEAWLDSIEAEKEAGDG